MPNTPESHTSTPRGFESTGSCPPPSSTGITPDVRAMGIGCATDADHGGERGASGPTLVLEVGFGARNPPEVPADSLVCSVTVR